MEQMYLIDTCAVIKYLAGAFPQEGLDAMDAVIDDYCKISVITKIELLAWNPENPEDMETRKQFLENIEVVQLDDDIVNCAIDIRKQTKIKLPDSLIAATALASSYVLISDNDKDFDKVDQLGLIYRNPQSTFRLP